MSNIKRKVLVTGASAGIGEAIVQHLSQGAYEVVGIARDFSKSSTLPHHIYEQDLSKIKELPSFYKQVLKEHGDVSALIANVGMGLTGHLENYSYEMIEEVMHLNFLSAAFMVKTFIPMLKRQDKSDLIFIGSEAALKGARQGSVYCASKFALRGFAQSLRDETMSTSLRVNMIHPGMVRTDFFQSLSIEPTNDPLAAINKDDIAQLVSMILNLSLGTVIDEIILSPQKKSVQKKKS